MTGIADLPHNVTSIDRETTFARYMTMAKPQIAKLHAILVQEGHKIALITLKKWAAEDNWRHLVGQHKGMSNRMVYNTMSALKKENQTMDEQVIGGLATRLVCFLGEALVNVKVNSPDDVKQMLEAIKEVRALQHDLRGDKFNMPKSSPDGKPTTVVALGSFKKPPEKAEDHG